MLPEQFAARRDDAFKAAGLYAVFVLTPTIDIAAQLTDPDISAVNLVLALARVPHHAQLARRQGITAAVHVWVSTQVSALARWKDRRFSRPAILATTIYDGIRVR